MSGKRKCGQDSEPEHSATVIIPCKKARGGEEDDDKCNIFNMVLPSLVASYTRSINEEKKVVAVALLPSDSKDAKINVPTDESSTGMFNV